MANKVVVGGWGDYSYDPIYAVFRPVAGVEAATPRKFFEAVENAKKAGDDDGKWWVDEEVLTSHGWEVFTTSEWSGITGWKKPPGEGWLTHSGWVNLM